MFVLSMYAEFLCEGGNISTTLGSFSRLLNKTFWSCFVCLKNDSTNVSITFEEYPVKGDFSVDVLPSGDLSFGDWAAGDGVSSLGDIFSGVVITCCCWLFSLDVEIDAVAVF